LPVCGGKARLKILFVPFSFADQSQTSNHRAYLMMEERACSDVNGDILSLTLHGNGIESLDRTLCLTMGRAECRKVVFSRQYLRCIVHRASVQILRNAPAFPLVQCQRRASVGDFINILPPDTGKTSVPVIRNLFTVQYGYRLRS